MKYSKYTTPAQVKEASTEKLLELWELTEYVTSKELPTVRGWLMDEIESRNPEGFTHWLDESCEDSELRNYIL